MAEIFQARESRRGKYLFAEIFQTAGPETIGDTKRGTVEDLFGWQWLAIIERSGILRAYQEIPDLPGEWREIEENLPPIFGTVLPGTARRMSFAFDQSARVIVALEVDQVVQVTRWDSEQNQYVQNVSFPGVNPVLTMDALARVPISESDVVLFYQPPDAQDQINYRLQRELYNLPHTIYLHDAPVILDRAEFIGPQLQLLVSDVEGNPLRADDGSLGAVASDLYPIYVQDTARFDVRPENLLLEQTTYSAAPTDPVRLRVGLINPDGGRNVPLTPPAYDMATQPGTALAGSWRTGLRTIRADETGCGTPETTIPGTEGVGYLTGRNIDWVSPAYDAMQFYGTSHALAVVELAWHQSTQSINIMRPPPRDDECTLQTWSRTQRTLILELGIGATDNPAQAAYWWEHDRITGLTADTGSILNSMELTLRGELDTIMDERYPFLFLRLRSTGGGQTTDGSAIAISAVPKLLVMPHVYAHVSSVVEIQATDAARFAVRPVNLDLVSSTVRQQPADPVRFTVAPIPTLDLVYNTAIEAAADCARFTVAPINLEMRRTS